MICSKCGAAMPDDSVFCAQCGASMTVAPEVSAEPVVEAAAPTVEPAAEATVEPIVEPFASAPTAEPFAPVEENTPPQPERAQYVYSQPSYSQPVQPQNAAPQYYNGGAQQTPYVAETPINSTIYLIFAILVTVMCCLPFGIPAIIYAAKIDKLQAMGDFMGAKAAAKSSKMWSIIAGISIVVLIIAYVALLVVGITAGGLGYSDYSY